MNKQNKTHNCSLNPYRGWKITYNKNRPVTGIYVAESFGVTLSAGKMDTIYRMVDQRIKDYPPNGHGNYNEQ